jgi:hypothetical protein
MFFIFKYNKNKIEIKCILYPVIILDFLQKLSKFHRFFQAGGAEGAPFDSELYV